MQIKPGEYVENPDGTADHVQRALVAAGGPMLPPKDWFAPQKMDGPTPITVDDDGHIHGHIASWQSDHIGLPPGTKPPRSNSDYAFFKTGVVRTDDGTDVPVGQITLAGGHAPINASAQAAVEHYDNTASAIADVAVFEDDHGIYVTGGIRPDITDTQLRALRASAPSGDWRPIDPGTGVRGLELVAVCQVNTPGFPIARAMVASGGEITALVAAGASDMYRRQVLDQVLVRELDVIHSRIDDQNALIASLKGKAKSNRASRPGAPFPPKNVADKETDDSKPVDADTPSVKPDFGRKPATEASDERRKKLRAQRDALLSK